MEQYQYKPLSPGAKNIRLAVIHAQVPSRPEDIRVTILETPLEAERRILPSFMALSYVWGDTKDRRDLTVVSLGDDPAAHDLTSPKRLSVTANLAEALNYLPWRDRIAILWIDAICINQEDTDERSEQVKLMAEIYSSAGQVLAWLGPPTLDSNFAMTMLQRIGDSIEVDWTSFEIRPKDSQWACESSMATMYFRLLLDLTFKLPWNGQESQAFESLFNRPWFERLWIRQEITLGAERAVLICGPSSIPWSSFRKAAIFLNKKVKDPSHPRFEHWRARVALVAEVCTQGGTWLGQMLRQMQRTSCTDPRDRVYGILGILPAASKGMADLIRPNYQKPLQLIYQELLAAEIVATGRADLLSECLLPRASSTPTWTPSWAANWAVRRKWDLHMMQQCADGQSAVAVSLPDPLRLRIKGVLAATIVDMLEFPPLIIDMQDGRDRDKGKDRNDNIAEQPRKIPPVVALIKEIAEKLDLSERAPYRPSRSSTVLEALCYALSGGQLKDHISADMAGTSTPSMAQFKRLVKFALEFDDDDASAWQVDVVLCMGTMFHACRDRALLVTREGYIGAGPASAQPGDKIAVIPGCMRPLVLRPENRLESLSTTSYLEHDIGRYTVVGPCNVHGLNWGEALLGPLPDDVTLVWRPSGPSWDAGPVFRNSDTGEETVADPRIDWRLLKTDGKEGAFMQRAEAPAIMSSPGKADNVSSYRRPDVVYFASLGVELANLDLV